MFVVLLQSEVIVAENTVVNQATSETKIPDPEAKGKCHTSCRA